jgi:hypothetical protein
VPDRLSSKLSSRSVCPLAAALIVLPHLLSLSQKESSFFS